MLHCPRTKFPCPSPQRSTTHDTYHLNPSRALRSCRHRRSSQCCPDAGRGNLPRYLRARSRRHDPWQLKESRSPRRVGDCSVTSIECNSRDGHSSPNTVETTADRMAETESSNDYTRQLGVDPWCQSRCTALCYWRVPSATTNPCFQSRTRVPRPPRQEGREDRLCLVQSRSVVQGDSS